MGLSTVQLTISELARPSIKFAIVIAALLTRFGRENATIVYETRIAANPAGLARIRRNAH
jgi:hypothetical protein